MIKKFLLLLVVPWTALAGVANAGLLVQFTATIDNSSAGTSFNGHAIGGETLTIRYVLDDAAPLNPNYSSGTTHNYFDISDSSVTNTITVSGLNGATFSQDVFYSYNYLRFYDTSSSDGIFLRAGSGNANVLRGTGTSFLEPLGSGLDGTVAGVISRLTVNDFAGTPSTSTSSSTTIEGGGNTLVLKIREIENITVHVSEFDANAVPNPEALGLMLLGVAVMRRRRVLRTN